MQTVGNSNAEKIYGTRKVAPEASKAEKKQYVMDKYDKKLFAAISEVPTGIAASEGVAPGQTPLHRERGQVTSENTSCQSGRRVAQDRTSAPVARVAEVSDSLFDELFADWSTPIVQKSEMVVVAASPSNMIDDFWATAVAQNSHAVATKPSDLLEDIFRAQAAGRATDAASQLAPVVSSTAGATRGTKPVTSQNLTCQSGRFCRCPKDYSGRSKDYSGLRCLVR